jgi:hypothetical protein
MNRYLYHVVFLLSVFSVSCGAPKEQETASIPVDSNKSEDHSQTVNLEFDDVKFENIPILKITRAEILKFYGKPKKRSSYELDLTPKRRGEQLEYDSLEVFFEKNDSLNWTIYSFNFTTQTLDFSPKDLAIGSEIQNIKKYISENEWQASMAKGVYTVWLFDKAKPQDCFLSITAANGKVSEVHLNMMLY